MNPLANIKPVKMPNITLLFVEITPEIAADWLKRNRKNRKVKERSLEAFVLDMKNNAWLLTHQGIAFDEHGDLMDGQHRLLSIVASKRPIVCLVSVGWPVGDRKKVMDAVDRGVARTLADQLSLQHGMTDAAMVVKIVSQIAAACGGLYRVRKNTTDSILSAAGIYKAEINYVLGNPIKQQGLRSATAGACIALGRAIWPDKVSDFYTRLKTGENLAGSNPILPLRNWLMGSGSREEVTIQRAAICHHLHAFVEGRTLGSLVSNSTTSLNHMLQLQLDRVKKVCAIYDQPVPEIIARTGVAEAFVKNGKADESNKGVAATSTDGIAIGRKLSDRFTSLDLQARLDGPGSRVGLWLQAWRIKGWIETAGPNEFTKTAKFGK